MSTSDTSLSPTIITSSSSELISAEITASASTTSTTTSSTTISTSSTSTTTTSEVFPESSSTTTTTTQLPVEMTTSVIPSSTTSSYFNSRKMSVRKERRIVLFSIKNLFDIEDRCSIIHLKSHLHYRSFVRPIDTNTLNNSIIAKLNDQRTLTEWIQMYEEKT